MTIGLIFFILTIAVNIAIGVAIFDAAWCRKMIGTIGSNMGKIWMSGAVVAILMVVAGIGFGMTTGLSKAMAERNKSIAAEMRETTRVKKPSVAPEPSNDPVFEPRLYGRKPWEFDRSRIPY